VATSREHLSSLLVEHAKSHDMVGPVRRVVGPVGFEPMNRGASGYGDGPMLASHGC
jgi:hypothetical protein